MSDGTVNGMNISGVLRGAGLGAAIIVLAAAPALAQAPVTPNPDLPKWGPFIDLQGTVGTTRNIGEGDLFVPLLQNGTSMLFTDIRTRFDDRNDHEGNFGLGIRHMLSSGWNLGFYGYYDRRRTPLGPSFSQATFGAEALSLNWDFRANVYRPIGPHIATLSDVTTTSSTASSSSSAAVSGTAVQVTTTTTTTTTTTRDLRQEVEQPGFDAEIGWRVPIFAPGSTTQLRLYAGGYRFHAAGTRMIAGPRARLDLTIGQVPHLWRGARLDLGATLQHDGPRGTQAFASLSLRIPLEIFPSERPSALTPMERRMEDPIVRDVDVVAEPRSSTTASTSTSTTSLVEDATETTGGSTSTVINSASTSGASLPTAVANAGANSTVLLSGTFDTTATTTLQSGQTLTNTLDVKTPSGYTATLTTAATIAGAINGSYTVDMANNSTLKGLTVSDTASGANAGLAVRVNSGVTGATISNSTLTAISGTSDAIALNVFSSSSGTMVSGNTLTATSSNSTAVGLDANSASLTVTNNTFSATNATTNEAEALNFATIESGSTGNVNKAGTCSNGGGNTGQIDFADGSHCP